MHKPLRSGKSGVLAIGLFLLSCLIVLPSWRWLSNSPLPKESSSRRDFKFTSDRLEKPYGTANVLWEGNTEFEVVAEHWLPGWSQPLAQVESVFWEPDDTLSLREWIDKEPQVPGCEALEIGTGTGIVSLAFARAGAARVVATDINPAAFANANMNAEQHALTEIIEYRLVDEARPGPFEVIRTDESFDLIVSNPPWEDAPVEQLAAYALYDPDFGLLDAMLRESKDHLKPGGRLLLAYGAKTAIERILSKGPEFGWQVTIEDDRALSDLPEVFLPGMLLVLTPEDAAVGTDTPIVPPDPRDEPAGASHAIPSGSAAKAE